jgi:rhodanese-related sulfurtransferase
MTTGVREIPAAALAAARRDGALVVDVREPHEYVAGHVPCARLVPLSTVAHRAHELASDRPVYVICRTGVRSANAAATLHRLGVDAVSVAGGTEAWASAGMPVITGPHAC